MAALALRSVLRTKVHLKAGRLCYSSSVPTVKLFIDGKFVESKSSEWLDIHNPATNEVIARVPKATQEEMLAAVDSCSRAFRSWSETSVLSRQQIFLRYQQLIKDNIKELAKSITLEQGKTLADAEGDVFRGLQVVEHACSITSLMLGETLPSITKDMDTYTYRLPIGVCAGIAPFNFPAMIPLWMFPLGMVCGNTYLLKPSERVPTCTMLLAKMLQDAGAPDGTLNVIHGQHAACGSCVRGSGTALHGPVHGHPGGRGAELAAGAGGACQGSASKCRVLHHLPVSVL
ncbi:Methylmalonate-semialdehyde dehydrogenase [acylating] mitochondrial [Xenoophorus captivus]|uniref:Methylmalonate-semialdehyde dehydrogenase [acylating] mitochondrial n=1 Tax=Xenoophorus captivus TaxID=1517983 RepID=A0ABV0RUU2_9TELE